MVGPIKAFGASRWVLLQARDEETGRVMSDEELVRNLVTFILAGHETTAVALTWTLAIIGALGLAIAAWRDKAAMQRTSKDQV